MEGIGIDFSIDDENKTIEMVVNLGNKITNSYTSRMLRIYRSLHI